MAFSFPTEVLPKALATGLIAWGAMSYFFTGPEVAARVAEFDHFPACFANYKVILHRSAEVERQALPAPNTENDIAIEYTRNLMNNEMMQVLGQLGGWGGTMESTLGQLQAKQRAAREAYERGIAEIETNTRRKLANSDGFCGCVADAAIDKSRTDWALYAGSLGLFSGSKVENLGAAMTNPENVSACAGTKETV